MSSALVIKASAIAEMVHSNQRDKAGRAYIDHPRRVASRISNGLDVPEFTNGLELSKEQREICIAAGWMHDVLEDSGTNGFPSVLASDLIAWGFEQQLVEVVRVLSRGTWLDRHTFEKISDENYYANLSRNPIALLVKLADIADNTNQARIELMAQAGGSVKPGKYENALKLLGYNQQQLNWLALDQSRIY